MKKSILALLSAFLLISGVFGQSPASDTLYNGKRYPMETGKYGGRYFKTEDGQPHYEKKPRFIDHGDTATEIATGRNFPVNVGPRGGRSVLVDGKKVPLPRK